MAPSLRGAGRSGRAGGVSEAVGALLATGLQGSDLNARERARRNADRDESCVAGRRALSCRMLAVIKSPDCPWPRDCTFAWCRRRRQHGARSNRKI